MIALDLELLGGVNEPELPQHHNVKRYYVARNALTNCKESNTSLPCSRKQFNRPFKLRGPA